MNQARNFLISWKWGFIFGILITSSLLVQAQTSVFQDASGESAFKVFGSAITINTTNQNISFSSDVIRRVGDSSEKFNRWGINAKLTAKEGLANLKGEDGFLIDGEFGLYRGWKITKNIGAGESQEPGWAHEKYVSINADVDRNKLYDFNRVKDKVTFNKGYAGWKLESGWFGYYGNFLWGFSVNGGQKTNSADIKQKSVSTLIQSSYQDSVAAYKQESAYDISELKSDLFFVNANADLAISLVKDVSKDVGPILLALHLRYQALQNDKNKFNPALGVYISKIRAPRDVVIGVNAQFQDVFNASKNDTTSWQRLNLNLTAGFKLN